MKASPTYLLTSLSNNDVTFFIPPYQRNYEWSIDTCRVLLDDIRKVTTANLAGDKTEHFFGSIVYVVEESQFGQPAKYVLTDGQQRITTTMLFLMALRDSIDDQVYRETIQKRYIQNERAADDTEYKIKLKQIESDWTAYKLLALGQEVPNAFKNSRVFQNYGFFRREIAALNEADQKAYLEQGLVKFSIITIQLEPDSNKWENPQEIFESMNSLGQPLSLADLVRNYLLMGKGSREQTDLYNHYWLQLERCLPGKLSEFIRDWMQANQHRSYKVARENNYKELYSAFKEITQGRSTEELFGDFVRFSRPYSMICGSESTGNDHLDQVIIDLNIIGVAPAYSFLTEVLECWCDGELSDPHAIDLLTAVRTYLLRRRVLGITQAENKSIPVLGSKLAEVLTSPKPHETLFNQFSSQEYALRLPNDDELSSGLSKMNFYNLGRSRNYPRLLLSLIEEHLTKSRPNWDDPNLQLEHIMPQSLSPQWRVALGDSADEVHQEFINNIGNITLIRHNQELGNKSFAEKKAVYTSQSGLQVTQNYVLDCDTWNSKSIRRRQEYLIGVLLNSILKLPDALRHASNWNQTPSDGRQFDAREILNPLIGETINFVPNPSITALVLTDSTVLFEGREWHLTPLTTELKRREGGVSPASSFYGPSNWSWDGIRLAELDL